MIIPGLGDAAGVHILDDMGGLVSPKTIWRLNSNGRIVCIL